MAQSEGKVKCSLSGGLVSLANNIFIEPDETPSELTGGIIVPDSCKNRAPTTGKVYRIGLNLTESDDQGNRVFKTPIRKGDRVMFSIYAGIRVTFEDEKVLICLKEEDLLAIVEPSKEMLETAGEL